MRKFWKKKPVVVPRTRLSLRLVDKRDIPLFEYELGEIVYTGDDLVIHLQVEYLPDRGFLIPVEVRYV